MTADEYFNDHLPHRVNLLTTFRDRYSPNTIEKPNRPKQPFDQPRDFFRCSKDVSIMMVRFFCDEMGLHLKEGASDPKERKPKCPFAYVPFTLAEAKIDPRKYQSLVIVLKAANRAVAHLDEKDVNHSIKNQADHDILFEIIDWIEQLIETNIYAPNNRSLAESMKRPNNDMGDGSKTSL